jgi:predicted acylesterase/phospholipase RssA/CRP-like cAMP-binding protein
MNDLERDPWREQLASHLAALFDTADPAALTQIEADVEWVSLSGGETLFRRGEPGDAAYILISGRLRVVDDARTLNEVGAGETVGEMALLSGELRSATVYAVRDSLLAKLSADAFHRLVERYPRVLRRITGLLVERLRNYGAATPRARSGVKTIAIVPAGERGDAAEFSQRLAGALALHGATLVLDPSRIDRSLERNGIARSGEHDLASLRLVQWLNEQELAHRFVLYEADSHPSPWTDRAVRQADQVLFIADAAGTPEPGEIERQLADRWRGARAPTRTLVLLHSADGAPPQNTSAFLAPRLIDRHYHVRAGSAEDFARLARCLAGVGIGLVLGGGGARGLAHLGVLRALSEAGVPIDWVGGTSIGALIAALVAQRRSPDEAFVRAKEYFVSLRDPTLPLVSLLAGRRIGVQLERALGDVAIEDLPLPYFCVSTNLSRATQTIHERGLLVRAIRASISLPGILPPVSLDRDLHVDGGLVNNLPIDVMAVKQEIGAVLAVDVSAEVEMRTSPDLESALSGWRVLWRRINPRAERTAVPGIMTLLTRSAIVASIHWERERRTAEAASLYLHIPLADLRLLAFERIDEIAARGYESTREKIRVWWAEHCPD